MSHRTVGGALVSLLLLVGAAACGDDGDVAQIDAVESGGGGQDDADGSPDGGEPDGGEEEPVPAEEDGAAETVDEADDSSLLLIMDASGSMNSRGGDGDRLIDGAKAALHDLVDQLPDNQNVGLRVYGHRFPNDDRENGCQDTELIHPVGPLDRDALNDAIDGYDAEGFTPIGISLEEAAVDLPSEGERTIVLVSDGLDTCAPPDPCDVAEDLATEGIDTVIHTVGFALDQAEPDEADAARDELGCIARVSDGQFVDVETADELAEALEEATRESRVYETAGTELEGSPLPREAATGEVDTPHTDLVLGDEVNFYRFDVPRGREIQGEMIVTPANSAANEVSIFCPNIYLVDRGDTNLANPQDFAGGDGSETFIKHTDPVEIDDDEVWIRVETGECMNRSVGGDAEFNLEIQLSVIG